MKLYINDLSQWTDLTLIVEDRWNKKPEAFEVELKEPTRSTQQNSLIHALFQQCADKYNAKPDRVRITTAQFWKVELKEKLGKKQVHIDLDDNPTVIIVSTKDYKKKEISDFVHKIQHHMAFHHQVDIDTNEIREFLGHTKNRA